jgi:hypothetical protein
MRCDALLRAYFNGGTLWTYLATSFALISGAVTRFLFLRYHLRGFKVGVKDHTLPEE